MRLIDADVLRAQFPEPEDWGNPYKALVHITGILAEVDNAPTIEMPEIIHCRDCKHYYFADNSVKTEQCWVCGLINKDTVDADDFCSRAERWEDEQDG